jgi:hypothetical protein
MRLSVDELLAMINANMNAFGWVAEKLEWLLMYACVH